MNNTAQEETEVKNVLSAKNGLQGRALPSLESHDAKVRECLSTILYLSNIFYSDICTTCIE